MKRLNFAAVFILVRRDLELSQVRLAEELGISQPSLSKIENGLVEPPASALVYLSRLAKREGKRESVALLKGFIWGSHD